MRNFSDNIINWRTRTALFQEENKLMSWFSLLITLCIIGALGFTLVYFNFFIVKLVSSILLGLTLVRLFSLYHEYNHGAILRDSFFGRVVMSIIGFLLLSPMSLWRNYHDLHHRENSKFSLKILGDFPTVTLQEFDEFSKEQKKAYLLKRNFFVILFGYITVFILSFNLRPFKDNPRKHFLGFVCFFCHVLLNVAVYYFLGFVDGLLILSVPLMIFGFIGALVFYLQHNCEGLRFYKTEDWDIAKAAIYSSSYIQMNLFWRFFTANVGFHSVHHLNSLIPHYHLPKAMQELENNFPEIVKIQFSIRPIVQSFKLKAYDLKKHKLVEI